VSRLSLGATRHDPFWDLDGKGARRSRLRRKLSRAVVLVIAAIVVGLLVTRLPAVDPAFLMTGDGRPILAAAIFTLLGSTILLGLARLRHAAPH
jgi:hypothetical protein